MSRTDRALETFAKSRLGGWYFIRVAPKIDVPLLKASKGRFSANVGTQVCLLETTGAKSGQVRLNPLVYVKDGDRVVLTASKAGATKHPAWFHNLKANPDVRVALEGRWLDARARVTEGEERGRLWAEVNDYYAGYDTYQGRAGARVIPVVVLEPKAG